MKIDLLAGAALCALLSSTALAQSSAKAINGNVAVQADPAAESPAQASGDIVVTGIRNSLRSSVANKRNALNIVDSISAEDTGKFPDNNVAESLQRVTGVAIDRSGGEGQFITVRGLGPEFNTVLVNGRVMATDNDGREFSFDVLSSNMIQRTDVYKSSVPQLQEGGIGATVNIVTARPLDGKSGFHVAAAAGGIYDTLAKQASPDMSGVASWANPEKTLGAVLSASFTDRRSLRDFVDTGGFVGGSQQIINGTVDATNLPASALGKSGDVRTPRQLNFNREFNRRKRINVSGAVQARLSDSLLLTLDGIYSKFDVKQTDRYFGVYYTRPFIGLQTDATGTVTGFNRPGTQFLAANPALTDPALGDLRGTPSQNDNIVNYYDRRTMSYQLGANLAWEATDRLSFKFDASTTKATRNQPHQFVVVGSLAQTSTRFDLNPDQDLPSATNLGPITDPNILRAHYAYNEMVRVKDQGKEFHADGTWKLEGFVKSVMFGAAYNERRKTRNQADNSDAACTYCGYEVPVSGSYVTPFSLSGFLTQASGSGLAPKNFFTFNPADIFAYLSQPSTLAIPTQGRTPAQQAALAAQLLALPNGPYGLRDRPINTLDVQEKVWAGYANITVGGPRWSGDVGARIVSTSVTSRGFGQSIVSYTANPNDDILTFVYSDPAPIAVKSRYTNVLPSANVKYELASNMLLRGAVSKTVTRPTLTSLGVNNSYSGRSTDAVSSGGNPQLKPFQSWNFDTSYEWYLSDVSYVSVAGFYKKFSNFLENQTLPVPFQTLVFQDTRARNGQTGSIAGVEVGGQYTFDRVLPGILSGLGVSGNYTYVTSKVKRAQTDVQCGYTGLSPHSANGSIFYEKFGIQGRVSYNWRSSFLRACFGAQSQPETRAAYGQLDFSLAYNLTPHFQVYVQGVNVTDSYVRDYSVYEERLLLLQDTGARYVFGIRAKF